MDIIFSLSCIKVLETEVHEGTLIECLSMLAQWSTKLSKEFPKRFVDLLPKSVSAKSGTCPVRCAYYSCLFEGLRSSSNTLSSALPLIPTLLKSVESASKQPSQAGVVGEGLHAAACLVKLSLLESETQAKLEDFWKTVTEKDLFNNEKFLAAASPEALACGTLVAEKVVLQPESGANNKPWLRLLAAALLCPDPKTRKTAVASAKRIVSALGGDRLAVELVQELEIHLSRPEQSEKIDFATDRFPAEPPGGSLAKHTVQALEAISGTASKGELDQDRVASLCRSAVNPCHRESVYAIYPKLWERLASKMTDKLSVNAVGVMQDVVDEILKGELRTEAVRSLVKIDSPKVVPKIVSRLQTALQDPKLIVSAKDYQIFLTPKGELFDKQFLDNLLKSGDDSKNMKRENKAYSYKEQMEELALRKELEEKRRKEGKVVEPKLTPKQKEALNQQLEKEDIRREEVKLLKGKVDPIIKLCKTALETEPRAFGNHVNKLKECIFAGTKSPVSAEGCCELYRLLRRGVFYNEEDETLAQLICAAVMQVKQPSCELPPPPMTPKEISANSRSVIMRLGEASVPSMAEDADAACPVGTPAFSYAFPVMEHAVRKHMDDDEFVVAACNIINEHVQLRGSVEMDDIGEPDDLHPKHLPMEAILRLTVEIISSTGGRTQQLAAGLFVDTCDAASGKTGCASINESQLQIVMGALQSEVAAVRDAGLRGFRCLLQVLPEDKYGDVYQNMIRRMWVSRFDEVEEIAMLGREVWDAGNFATDPDLSMRVIDDVTHPVACVRSAGASALAELLEEDADSVSAVVQVLMDTFTEKLTMTKPVMDHLGRVVQDAVDHWEPRSGIALALKKLAPLFDVDTVASIADFLVPTALDDRNETVRNSVLDAAVHIVDIHGKQTAGELLPVFERFMDETATSATHDNAKQSVVILMGSLAKHLDPQDPKVRPIIRQLIIALNTPSQQVQEAVSQCLPPLVPAIKEEAPDIISSLIQTLLGSNYGYGERKGAAHGIAGLVKGLGILSLKQLDIMGRLSTAIQDKKNPSHREGALFAFEMLCNMLGRLFEPYIVHILPHLLLCFGDSVEHVRQAADDTARAVMRKLSAHGVKLVLPALLKALKEDQWRTKSGSVELLGAMAHCAPKQLSSCLPDIVPKLIEVLGDSHHKVQKAGAQALKQIGSVIRNPEIQAIVPILLKALQAS